ncbi:MAG TPA: hydroxyacid dehydrogenase [Spirochaetia bacterium]|nr:hydroxyacid dehydrogenase [Spirochaetia bacterium]
MAFKVLIPQDIAEEGKKYLRERGYEIKMGSGITVEAIREDVKDCDAILARTAPFPGEVLRAGKRLKVVARHGVGIDNIDVKTATELGIYVTNAPESNANSVAEHTVGLIVALAKGYLRFDREFRSGNFEIRNQLKGQDLEGKTLGIIGVGRIGRLVAKKALKGFDMRVLGYDPYVTGVEELPELEVVTDWETPFRESDFITLHLPATADTRGIIGKKELGIMKSTAYLINAARGEIVNEEELIRALREKKIAGAGLDVFEKEPPEKNNPLLKMENVIATPHNAALTAECSIRMALHAAMGIDDVLSGRKPRWPVNIPV